ncbi:hypothetical protein EsH8_I_001260 [Colletotrichum jinshuiense]
MFQSLPEPPKILEVDCKERTAITTHGTVTPNADLPSTWKLTLSSSSSLEKAMEAASQEMERKGSKDAESEPIIRESLVGQGKADVTTHPEARHDEPVPHLVSKENIQPPAEPSEQATGTPKYSDGPVPKEHDDRDIDDRDVLRGLHIAISAACDEEVDAWIRQKTGVRIRRFLADLRAFETLGEEEQPDPSKERARRRRAESRKLKAQIRQSKAAREARAQR